MSNRLRISIITTTTFALMLLASTVYGQAARPNPNVPRMKDGKPNLTGLWQALGTAYWDIRDHSAQQGPFYQLGAIGATPAALYAVSDALYRAYGIRHVEMPATPLRIWTAIRAAAGR